ncbi:hypothetical protein STVIR_8416 [Streptomyces viridochromogenes Tue57]|uniref:Uncharacterized protein n=1 Tax=Streptomyces viridochromogenes Tue57 TaxID=1160705 RepID=L8P285_STRVR|nr:hypothetical protein STVIR_8416 [Streptomyces viridochromogenes Tue57]
MEDVPALPVVVIGVVWPCRQRRGEPLNTGRTVTR